MKREVLSFAIEAVVPVIFGWSLAASNAEAQDRPPNLRSFFTTDGRGAKIEAPEGYQVVDEPLPDAAVLREIPGPKIIYASNYLEVEERRYYLTSENRDRIWDGGTPEWIAIKGTGRSEFIAATIPAKLIKKETRDFFKTGPQTAEVYEETVPLTTVTTWGPSYRIAEIDYRLPVKVSSFFPVEDGSWELRLTAYPAFESETDRIPGPPPEIWGEPYRALITRPAIRETSIRGLSGAERLRAIFQPGTVWAAACSEGRIQELRIGWHELEPPMEVSRLSPPQVAKGNRYRFRFSTNRLLDSPIVIEVEPDIITGVDCTFYDQIAQLGGPSQSPEDAEFDQFVHQLWNLIVDSENRINVVSPLLDGRGAAGSLELESLGLGPSFEEELKALSQMADSKAPPLPPANDSSWKTIFEEDLGVIPDEQRGPETQFQF